jgi:hypothetical protein
MSELPVSSANLLIHVYQPTDGPIEDQFASGGDDDDEAVVVTTVCELPARVWEGLWDTLVYEDDIKSQLLNYIYATLIFSDANIDRESSESPTRTLITYTCFSKHRILESCRPIAWSVSVMGCTPRNCYNLFP